MAVYINQTILGQALLAFAVAYYLLVLAWAEIRKRHPLIMTSVSSLNHEELKIIKRGRYYRLLMLGAISVIICFAMYPLAYKNLLPFRELNNPVMNFVGLFTVACSLVRIVAVQLDFDRELLICSVQQKSHIPFHLMSEHGRKLQAGYLTMIFGVALTLSNVISIGLLCAGCVLYFRNRLVSA